MKSKYKIIILAIISIIISCSDNSFDNKFNKSPEDRVQETLKNYKQTLVEAPYGWQMTYSLGGNIEYISYQIAYFYNDNTVKLHSTELKDPISSEYKLMAEADIEIVFNTFNENLTVFSYPNEKAPKGYGGDVEFNFKSINKEKNEIILEGKVNKGILRLRKAKEKYNDFSKLQEYVTYLAKTRTAKYMNLAITEGLDDFNEEKPFLMGLDLSSIARVGDYSFNYKGEFKHGRKMLYFSHSEMGLSTPIEIGGHKIQYFQYNKAKKRYEITNSDLKGYLYCSDLPVYYVPKVVDEFKDNYSLWMRASFGKVNQKYMAMRRALPKIEAFVIVTDYKQRIPLFDKDGQPLLDSHYNHDYKNGEKLGDGLLFSFEGYNQFYFYFVPIKIEKLQEDRVRFKREGREICKPKEGENSEDIFNEMSNNEDFNNFIDYICNEKGWYIKRTIESGQIDWDFISQSNPKQDYFYTRLK